MRCPARLACRAAARLGVLLAVLAIGLAGLLVAAAPAQAHAELVATEPADGASLLEPPAEVVLRFNEPVDLPPEPIRIFDADGTRVDAGGTGYGGDRSVLRTSLAPDLPDGVYVVGWRAISADGHLVRGSFTFAIGEVPAADLAAASPAVPEANQTGWEVAAGVARWLTYAGVLLAAGGVAFLVLVLDRRLLVHDRQLLVHDRRPAERERLIRVVGWATGAAVAGTVAGVPLQVVTVNGMGGSALGQETLWIATLSSGYGASAAIRLCGLTVLLVGVLSLWLVSWARPVALAGGLAALGSFLFAGHTATGEPRPLVWASHLSHTTAAAVWLGGLVLLVLVLRARRQQADDPVDGARVVARFSLLAVASVGLVTAAGAVLGWAEIRTWGGLTGTSYGQIVLAKAGLVAVVVAIGAYNNRRLVPAIRTGSGQAWRRLHRTVRWEAAALLVGVLAVTAVLVTVVPARNQVAAAESGPAGPYAATAELGTDHRVELVVEPARAGTNRLEMVLRDRAGAPVAAVERVELRFSLPAAGIERITREPEPAGPGRWRHTGPELSIAGDWEVEVRVTVDDFQRLTTTFPVPVAAAATQPATHPNHP